MLSKNHWVWPFFAIFRFIREILFVTVAFDHPVPTLKSKKEYLVIKSKEVKKSQRSAKGMMACDVTRVAMF